jgi:hypothetical protein
VTVPVVPEASAPSSVQALRRLFVGQVKRSSRFKNLEPNFAAPHTVQPNSPPHGGGLLGSRMPAYLRDRSQGLDDVQAATIGRWKRPCSSDGDGLDAIATPFRREP